MGTSDSRFSSMLQYYSTQNNLNAALSVYKEAKAKNVLLSRINFESMLFLCSSCSGDPHLKNLALLHGYLIYGDMLEQGIIPSEPSIACVAQLAAAEGDGTYAFHLVQEMNRYDLKPQLRTYHPALHSFCSNLDFIHAYQVEDHMIQTGLDLEEDELSALLKLSVSVKHDSKVQNYLQRLKTKVNCMSLQMAEIIERWFCSEGKWVAQKSTANAIGRCLSCTRELKCQDMSADEKDILAEHIARKAMKRNQKAFKQYQTWLETNYFGSVVLLDGANIGYFGEHFGPKKLKVHQIIAVVKELSTRNGNTIPLIFLHSKRVLELQQDPFQQNIVTDWITKKCLYVTPDLSYDDWYWIYGSLKLNCLFITNDEMEDHKPEHLGRFSFNLWKQRNRIHFKFEEGMLQLSFPKPYSNMIQESQGSWHIPLKGNQNEGSATPWLCIQQST